jgi:hypothetical protein
VAASLAFGAVLALSLAPFEYARYRTLLDVPGAAVGTAVVLILVGKTLGLMLPGAVAGIALSRLGRRDTALVLSALYSAVVAAYLWLDLLVHEVTGNHLTFYLRFLGEPDVWHWTGTPANLWMLFASQARSLALPAGGSFVLALGAGVLVHRTATARAPAVALAAVWLALIGAGPVLARFLWAPLTFAQLDEALPMSWNVGFGGHLSGLAEAQTRANTVYAARVRSQPTAAPAQPTHASPRARPHIIIVVVDGLRADAFNPTAMPRLWRWSERGTRFTKHYSNSNLSTGGMFALLAGRYPLDLDEGTRVEIDLPRLLRQDGYESHFFTSSSVLWGELHRFLGPPSFAVHEAEKGPTHWRDAHNVNLARALHDSGDRPQCLLLFLMSTHWLYSYPPRYASFTPDIRALLPTVDPTAIPGATMLLRAAHFLDNLLGPWLEGLDLGRTLVVVTGDHGESFNDDGDFFHGSRLSDAQTHVALVMAGAGVPAGGVQAGLSEHVDVVPTILALMGYAPAVRARLHGRPLFVNASAPGYATLVFRGGRRDGPRLLAFVSPDLRFSLRLGWQAPPVELLGKLDPRGGLVQGDLIPSERATFTHWFDDFAGRTAR